MHVELLDIFLMKSLKEITREVKLSIANSLDLT